MKNAMGIGKIYKYDGVIGEIVTDKSKYVFSYNGLEEKINVGDTVSFRKPKVDSDVVIDVKKYNGNDLKKVLSNYINENKIK